MDLKTIMKAKSAWTAFTRNHPKFPAFVAAVRAKGIKEGTIIGISITDTEGKVIETNIKISESDLQILEDLKGLK